VEIKSETTIDAWKSSLKYILESGKDFNLTALRNGFIPQQMK